MVRFVDVSSGMEYRLGGRREDVVLVCEVVIGSKGLEDVVVVWLYAGKQDGDTSGFKVLNGLTKNRGSRCVQGVNPGKPQDHDANIADFGNLK